MANNNKIKTVMENYNQTFLLTPEKVNFIHQKYITEFNKAFKNSKLKDPNIFIENILNFILSNEFESNFIRAIFGKKSLNQPIYKEEIEEFKMIFVNKMLKK